MSIFKAIGLYNRFQKSIKKIKKFTNEKQGLAEKTRGHIEKIE